MESIGFLEFSSIALRPFDSGDCAFLIKRFYPCMSEAWAEELICEWNQKSYQGSYFEMFAILCDSQPVGRISLYEREGAISAGPEIIEEYRQKGVGYAALRLALDHAKNLGYAKATAQVRKNNTASIKLHEKCGFTRSGECVTSRGNEAFLFEKDISS